MVLISSKFFLNDIRYWIIVLTFFILVGTFAVCKIDKTGEKVKESILCDDFSLTPLNNMNKNELGFSFIFSLICDCLTKSSSQRPDIFQIIKSYFKTNSSSIHNSNSIITTNTSNVNSSIKIK